MAIMIQASSEHLRSRAEKSLYSLWQAWEEQPTVARDIGSWDDDEVVLYIDEWGDLEAVRHHFDEIAQLGVAS